MIGERSEKTNYYAVIGWLLILLRRNICVLFGLIGIPEAVVMAILLLVSVLLMIHGANLHKVKAGELACISLMLLLFVISAIFAWNEYIIEYIQIFLFYCCVGGICCAKIRSKESAIRIFSYSTVIVFFLCAFLPLLSGARITYGHLMYYDTGMSYGENVTTPCFIGLYILFRYGKKKWALVLEIVNVILMIILANRGALIVSITFVILYELWVDKKTIKTIVLIIVTGILLYLLFIYLEPILIWVNRTLSGMGVRSYSISKYLSLLRTENGLETFMSGRGVINRLAIGMFREHPFFGVGIGTFASVTKYRYPHNLFTDVFSSTGIVGAMIIFGMLIVAIRRIAVSREKQDKLFYLILLSLWFPRLLFSKTFVTDTAFWCFLIYVLSAPRTVSTEYVSSEVSRP